MCIRDSPGQCQYYMSDNFYTGQAEIGHGFIENVCRITAADQCSSFFVDCLKPQLYPYRLYLVQICKKFYYIRV